MQTAETANIETVHKRVLKLMGNRFEISVVAGNEHWANTRIDLAIAEIKRIEQLLTTFKDDSQTNLINANAGIAPVKVAREVFDLIARSLKISELTQGAFDITYGSIDKSLWNFDVNMKALPSAALARESVRLINYKNVILDNDNATVFLKETGMRIGFGGIGKGYAADMAKALLHANGVKSGIVNAAGDLVTWGTQPNGKPWTIAIADPDQEATPFSTLNISNMAIATSGNYAKFAVIDGKRYSHTIDPKTGLPVSGIKSVTIISPSAEFADAMATPVTVMGVTVGLDMVNQLQQIACVIITDNNCFYTSKNINIK
ncbi:MULTISPECIES: FAD:protein FMN transferase [unclassified Mucilaginibacter]|uniref:FAD:protein FMN transferase n=1 Tax=unclassified Mucilaginibacter TaxID=2617802 RepID=UPI002AC93571|nr:MULTISPECIES: FAD:protein FMN transferase [unclassified Mucilaginibacter]MEB0260342.1 FAD:protein FMN transferase [Mucilaginibacter sp. 10I4]MEB0279381.1 FAD:protein FMN transferase [Mucilaginibacter sp. 10B2]MEB0300508.1 FAD:protein FMN transferase [Mucilaginibacter sp. 5C4]WPX21754.1 FAD:protein FMN transferase [Mucilaginibacter sp. 5C4]